ncbi:MAG: DoxX family protein [Bacteroidia bacterium]|nr:DoxX family protein [Bacteroidia bacterium]
MKIVNKLLAALLGGIFVFSGLIKLNDPVGTEIKLEEYFEVFAHDQDLGLASLSWLWETLAPYSLSLAIFLSVLEVVLGINLIMQYRVSSQLWFMLPLVIFFTFLTFYSAYFNKVTDCGCFGDAIKLTPWQSFSKDVFLLLLVIWLLINRRQFTPVRYQRLASVVSLLSVIGATFLGIYTYRNLPLLDFRPYHIGANIPKYMEPSDSLRYGESFYLYKDRQSGDKIKLSEETFNKEWKKYRDTTQYEYLDYDKPLLNPEAQARITDYQVNDRAGNNVTAQTFEGKKLLVIIPEVEKTYIHALDEINQLSRTLEQQNIQTIVLTATDGATFETFRHQFQLAILSYYFADKTVLKTMIRSNPGLIFLEDGTVINKWHYNNIPGPSELRP